MFQTENIFITSDTKMSDVVLNNPYQLLLLEHFGIEIPVQELTIADVCKAKSLSVDVFLAFANLYNGVQQKSQTDFSFTDIQSIIGYIKACHAYYLDEIYPKIKNTIERLRSVNSSSEILLVEKFFNDYFAEVTEHLQYENRVVHPYIISLYQRIYGSMSESSVAYSVHEYRDHHDDIEEKLNDLKNLLIKYLPESNDRQLRRKLLFSLSELEYDLAIHSQIEDFILIPLVERMEAHLK